MRTVAGELRAALERVLASTALRLSVAGRTDAGVHATAQVVSFTTRSCRLDLAALAPTLTRMLGPEIVVSNAALAPAGFDARHSATSRAYEFTVRNAAVADPLRHEFQWHVPHTLDLAAMNAAAAHFVGEHDFGSFCRPSGRRAATADGEPSLRRRVLSAEWREAPAAPPAAASPAAPPAPRLLVFRIEARAFCHQMVRSVVGFCVDVGRGRRRADEVPDVIAARDRNAAAAVAPPDGLTLVAVGYG